MGWWCRGRGWFRIWMRIFAWGRGRWVIEVAAQGRAKVVQDERGILGDVDNNGQVNLLDALLVAMYLANPASVLPDGERYCARRCERRWGAQLGGRLADWDGMRMIRRRRGCRRGLASWQQGVGWSVGLMRRRGLTDHESADYQPSWSPDGTQLVFQSTRDGETDIYVMGADGSNPTRLTEEGYTGSPALVAGWDENCVQFGQ